jgi:peroxiredoxin Q/BCP
MALQEGDRAPEFTLPSTQGDITLSDELRKGPVVVAFYPKDNTSGWIKELTSFREDYARFQEKNGRLLAISADTPASHQRFAARLEDQPFPLLSDTVKTAITAYGVLNERGTGAVRSIFIVGQDGIIKYANPKYEVSKVSHFAAIFDALARAMTS